MKPNDKAKRSKPQKNSHTSIPSAPKTIRRLALHTAIATAMLSGGYSRQSYAGSCSITGTNPDTVVCSGPADPSNDVTQSVPLDNPVISTTAGFGIETRSGSAIRQQNFGNISFTDANQSTITGQYNGIDAIGFGSLTITTTGTVTGIDNDGIYAKEGGNIPGDLIINSVNVSGGHNGITARLLNPDFALSVTNTGTINAGVNGIDTDTSSAATDTFITAATINAGDTGIRAQHNGSGNLSITSTDTITAGNNGINTSTSNSATDTLITTADINAGGNGIRAIHAGSGSLTITSTGLITTGNDGIFSATYTGSTDHIISVGDIEAEGLGIYANHDGTGQLSITASNVTSAGIIGIYANNSSNGTDLIINATNVSSEGGYDPAIFAINYGANLFIETTNIISNDTGIATIQNGSGSLSITNTGTITAGNDGIASTTGSNSVDQIINVGDIEAGDFGIYAYHEGSGQLSITTGNVISEDDGIYAYASSNATDLIINTGEVNSGGYGIHALNNGDGQLSITSTGQITALNSEGVYANLSSSGTDLTVAVTSVDAGDKALDVSNDGSGTTTVIATGMINSENSDAISVFSGVNGTSTAITAAQVNGNLRGVLAYSNGSGALSITTTGSVVGANGDGIIARKYGSGDLTLETAAVSGGDNGIYATSFSDGRLDITASGAVTGSNGAGIKASNVSAGTDVTITAVDVTGDQDGIKTTNYGSGALTINSTGTVAGATNNGIDANQSANGTGLTINANNVNGYQNGIDVDAQGAGSVSITATGTVSGETGDGINAYVGSTGTGLTINAADINADDNGIEARNTGSGNTVITSTGTITTNNAAGILALNSDNGTNLTVNAAAVTGGYTGIIATNNGAGALSITATDLVTSTYGEGIIANNSSNGTDLTINSAAVTGHDYGIYADQNGNGTLSITSTGTITSGNGFDGIDAQRYYGEGDMIIQVAAVTGDDNGIDADSTSGSLSITTTGTVTGNSDGITADSSGTDLTINTVAVTGGDDGIDASSRGSGALNITSSGTVTGESGNGINAYVGSTGTSLTINAADINAADNGIEARNTGSGNTVITSTGTITGGGDYGIGGVHYGNTGDLSITANNTSGGIYGIGARSESSGNLSITSTGTASGGTHGIGATNTTDGNNLSISANNANGGNFGVAANHYGTGALTINTTGSIAGNNADGIFALNSANGTDISITSTGDVTGGRNGIYATNAGSGNAGITATGLVSGTGGYGVNVINAINSGDITVAVADVYGYYDGISIEQNSAGSVTVTSTGTITAIGNDGVYVDNNGYGGDITINVTNINAYDEGINADQEGVGDLFITATGSIISQEGTGIAADTRDTAGDIIINAVDVYGGSDGIDANQQGLGNVVVTTTGTVTGETGDGINAYVGSAGSNLTINAADINAADNGIEARNTGSGNTAVTSTGTVTGGGVYGIGVNNAAGSGDLSINANNTSGSAFGIGANNDGSGSLSITSTGNASGGSHGIGAENLASGTDLSISANNADGGNFGVAANHYGTGALTINTTGSIAGNNADGIFALNSANGTDISITSTGDVTGGRNGIYATNASSGDTTINAVNTNGNNYGVGVINTGTGNIVVTSTGTAHGGYLGAGIINGVDGGDVTLSVNNAYGGAYGAGAVNDGSGSITMTATGTVVGSSTYGIALNNNAETSTTMTLTAANTTGGVDGIRVVHNGTGGITINTNGTVTGQSGNALLLERSAAANLGGSITNSGQLVAENQTAVMMDNGFNFTGSFVNQGTITGGNGVAIDASATNGGFSFTQVNGQVTGDILLGSGDDLVTIQGGLINGDIIGQGKGEVIFDLGEGNSLTAFGINNVRDYTVRSGRVNQVGDFSTAATTTTIDSGATMAFASTVNGSGAFVSSGELLFLADGINAGKLVQSGTVTLDNGSIITLDNSGLALGFDSNFELINATTLIDNGVTIIDNGSLLFDVELVVDDSTATATTSVADLGSISSLRNPSAFGDAVAAQAKLDHNFDNAAVSLLSTLGKDDVAGFEHVADSLSPSVSGAISNSVRIVNTLATGVVRDRLQAISGEEVTPANALWFKGFTATSTHDGADQVAGFEADTNGVVLGADHQWGQWQAGGALAMSMTKADNDRFAADEISTDSTQLMVYGSYQQKRWQIQGAASYAMLDFDMERNSLIAGKDSIKASTNASLMSLSAGVSYELEPVRGIQLRPLAALQFSRLSVDDFTESGGLDLTVEYDSISTLSSELGVEATTEPFSLGKDWSIAPKAHISWSHEFLAEEEQATARFDQQRFVQQGFEPGQDSLNVGAGVEFYNLKGLRISLDYQGQLGSDFTQHQGTVGVNYAF